MEAGFGSPSIASQSAIGGTPGEHQDDRLRAQLMAERDDAMRRRDALTQEADAQAAYHAEEINRCARVISAVSAALEQIDPPGLAVPRRDFDSVARPSHPLGNVPR